jgi:hypothetical protein
MCYFLMASTLFVTSRKNILNRICNYCIRLFETAMTVAMQIPKHVQKRTLKWQIVI